MYRHVVTIVIIGNNGQVSHYLQRALGEDYRVVATSREQLDLSNCQSISASLSAIDKAYSPKIIINPAAYTAVDLAEQEQEQANKINAQAVSEIGNYCAQNNISLIHFSTDYVFDGNANIAYTELDQPSPNGVYGKTKLAGEQALFKSNAAAVILRTAWVYSNHGKNFYKTMLELAKSRDTLSVVNDQFGAPTYAGSIADGVKVLVDHCIQQGGIRESQKGVYHFTCQGQTNWCDFADQIFKQNDLNIKVNGIPSSDYPTPAKRPYFSVLDGTKLQQTFGVSLPNWEDALADCVNETKQLVK